MMEDMVLIIGAGPSGLAVSNCLAHHSISNTILEMEDCCASLWKKRTYDRLHLHLGKEFCYLPYMRHSPSCPTFMPKGTFIDYIDSYVSEFNINPRYSRSVQLASYDRESGKWLVEAKNTLTGEKEVYLARFLVVASGENGEGVIPEIPGLGGFKGKILHSVGYRSGREFKDQTVLVVGCGNSGMEIAYDLSNYGAHSSIVVKSPIHVLHKETVYVGMILLKYIPRAVVDFLITSIEKLIYGDLSKHGIHRPAEGPFYLKAVTGKSPVLDVGTVKKIRAGEIKVLPGILKIVGNSVVFENGLEAGFDAIIFATGYRSTARSWLKDYEYVLDVEGMPKNRFPLHWKGIHGIYCAGLSREGVAGIGRDAEDIANDISSILSREKGKFE